MLRQSEENQVTSGNISLVDQLNNKYNLSEAKACFECYFKHKGIIDLKIIEQYYDTKLRKYPTNRQIWSISRQVYRANIQKHWSLIQFKLLIWTIAKYCSMHELHITKLQTSDYHEISRVFLDKQGEDVRKKLIMVVRASERKFSHPEEELIVQMHRENQLGTWPVIATQIQIQFNIWRSPRQIRDHWCCHLNPNLIQQNQLWTPQEELQLLELYLEHQNKWVQISKLLNRNDYQVKNKILHLLGKGKHSREYIKEEILKLTNLINKSPIQQGNQTRYIRAHNQQISSDFASTLTPVLCSLQDYKLYFCNASLVKQTIEIRQQEELELEEQDYDQYSIFQSRVFY